MARDGHVVDAPRGADRAVRDLEELGVHVVRERGVQVGGGAEEARDDVGRRARVVGPVRGLLAVAPAGGLGRVGRVGIGGTQNELRTG
jgi:hypothetical protein